MRRLLATGATIPRDLRLPGRELKGIYFAMDFLTRNTKSLLDSNLTDEMYIDARGKDVIVIGGGDTGADCIGTSLRHGCRSVMNFELLGQPAQGTSARQPVAAVAAVFRPDYSHSECKQKFGAIRASTRSCPRNSSTTGTATSPGSRPSTSIGPSPMAKRRSAKSPVRKKSGKPI
jgi:NADPH-dependent glutamate synthase beta subunit-like oxidoreductase